MYECTMRYGCLFVTPSVGADIVVWSTFSPWLSNKNFCLPPVKRRRHLVGKHVPFIKFY